MDGLSDFSKDCIVPKGFERILQRDDNSFYVCFSKWKQVQNSELVIDQPKCHDHSHLQPGFATGENKLCTLVDISGDVYFYTFS